MQFYCTALPAIVNLSCKDGDGKFVTHHHFFSSVNAALNGTTVDSKEIVCNGMVTGSNEEQALVNAAKTAFPNSKQLYCMIHCKDTARHY